MENNNGKVRNICMNALFNVLIMSRGKYRPLSRKDQMLGDGFIYDILFEIDGKDVIVNFTSFDLLEDDDNNWVYTVGESSPAEISPDFEEELNEVGLSRADLTPAFLASASEIKQFHMEADIYQNDKSKSVRFGYAGENCIPDIALKIQLKSISFRYADEETEYFVKDDVIAKFNGDAISDDTLFDHVTLIRHVINDDNDDPFFFDNNPDYTCKDSELDCEDDYLHDGEDWDDLDDDAPAFEVFLYKYLFRASKEEKDMFRQNILGCSEEGFKEFEEELHEFIKKK